MNLAEYRAVLKGISGVHATAYGNDGEIDAALTARIVARIADAGVHNIVTGGNTGEFYSMTVEEAIRLQAIAIKGADGKVAVTAAAGRSIRDAIRLSKAAETEGANGVMVHHPLDPFAAPQAQIDYFIAIAEAIDLPIVAYIRSDLIPLDDMVRLATHPKVAGVKFASQNTMLFFECCRQTKGTEANWICGLAESWALPFYALGGRGFTSGLVNVAPKRSLAVWNALEKGDYSRARSIVESIADFETMRTKYRNGANVTVVKEALQIQGFAVGDVRLPGLPKLEAADRQSLETIIAGWETDTIA